MEETAWYVLLPEKERENDTGNRKITTQVTGPTDTTEEKSKHVDLFISVKC